MVGPGLPILDQKLQGKVQRVGNRDRTGGGFTRFLEEFRDHRCIVNPALSDLVEDRTQSGAVLDCSIVSIVSDSRRSIRTFSAASRIF